MREGFQRFLALALLLAVGGCAPKNSAAAPEISREVSGEKAFEHVRRLVEFGPRPPGSPALENSRVYLTKQLEQFGWKVAREEFSDDTPRGRVGFVNLIATYAKTPRGAAPPSFLLCSHYDTKTFATARFVGANDGGSSTGLLLELARVLGGHADLAAKVELVFFDGEEAYVSFTDTDGLYGSRHFAKQIVTEKRVAQFRGGILFDMVGDRTLGVTLPPDSPPELARGIFAAADALNLRSSFTYFRGGILDDHTPLNAVGIHTIDLIDFDFPWWHTPEDTLDKISAESLQTVGAVALRYLVTDGLR